MKRDCILIIRTLILVTFLSSCTTKSQEPSSLFVYPDMQTVFEQYLALTEDICNGFTHYSNKARALCCIIVTKEEGDTLISIYRGFGIHQWLPPEGTPQDTPLQIEVKGVCFQYGVVCYVEYDGFKGKEISNLIDESILRETKKHRIVKMFESESVEEANTGALTHLLFRIHRPEALQIIDDRRGLNRNLSNKIIVSYDKGEPYLKQIKSDTR